MRGLASIRRVERADLSTAVPLDGERPQAEALLQHYAQHVPRYMVPRRVEFLPELPKTAHGKMDYQTLTARAAAADPAATTEAAPGE